MIIKGIVDLDTGHLLNAEGTAEMPALEIQAQETVRFDLQFQEAGIPVSDHNTIDDMDIVFAAKPTTDYTGTDYFAYQATWTKTTTPVGYKATIDFYTSEIVTGLANTASLSMHGQLKINDYPDTGSGDGHTRFSQLFPITLKNSVIASSATSSPSIHPLNEQTGTTYTLVLLDEGKVVTSSNSSAQTITVPPNSSVAFPVGSEILVVQKGTGQVTIAGGSGVTINSADGALKTRVRYSGVTLLKVGTNNWYAFGDITT
tara:strand:+ start:130 stop:906 length:777 start_codon:yes stop_codon:yes gene_type:complete